MAINMMKMKIGDKMCDVVDSSEYAKHPEFYDPQYTAIKIDEEMTLPIINKTDYSEQVVGAYPTPFAVFLSLSVSFILVLLPMSAFIFACHIV